MNSTTEQTLLQRWGALSGLERKAIAEGDWRLLESIHHEKAGLREDLQSCDAERPLTESLRAQMRLLLEEERGNQAALEHKRSAFLKGQKTYDAAKRKLRHIRGAYGSLNDANWQAWS